MKSLMWVHSKSLLVCGFHVEFAPTGLNSPATLVLSPFALGGFHYSWNQIQMCLPLPRTLAFLVNIHGQSLVAEHSFMFVTPRFLFRPSVGNFGISLYLCCLFISSSGSPLYGLMGAGVPQLHPSLTDWDIFLLKLLFLPPIFLFFLLSSFFYLLSFLLLPLSSGNPL